MLLCASFQDADKSDYVDAEEFKSIFSDLSEKHSDETHHRTIYVMRDWVLILIIFTLLCSSYVYDFYVY